MTTPHEVVAGVEALGTRRATPCGAGHVVWRIFGKGDPVVFLHGGMGSWMHWIKNIPELSRRFKMIVPDMPGHMQSGIPSGPYTPDSVAAVLVQGIEEILGPSQRYSVVGFSFGAAIGGHVARLGGERVVKLILLSPGGLGLPRGQTGAIQKWRHLTDPLDRQAAHRNNLQASMISDPAHVDELAVYIHATSTEAAKPVSAPISLSDTLQEALPRIKADLAGIWGAHDPASSPFMAERRQFFHSVQPQAPIVMLDGASHWAQYEVPGEFDAAVSRLLSSTWR